MQLNAPGRGRMLLSLCGHQDWRELGIRMETLSFRPWPRHGWQGPTLKPLKVLAQPGKLVWTCHSVQVGLPASTRSQTAQVLGLLGAW